uniref:Leucine-rich repeat-containing N-terminal plant-type domain-containing protein n=1 Tax=Manihot esculenta TaxID=3983 RepID=A0A2C9VMS5_MANES
MEKLRARKEHVKKSGPHPRVNRKSSRHPKVSYKIRASNNISELYLDYINITKGSKLLESLGAFSHLKNLSLESCKFEGAIPHLQIIGAMSSPKKLSLGSCGLNDTEFLNQGVFKLKQLQELDISYNDISGSLPSCLANMTSLQSLHLSSNNFVGNISLYPFNRLTNLEYLDLSHNLFQIPVSLGIDLSCNKLIGQIPIQIGYLNEIHVLNLSHNNLNGKIPASFSNLSQIESLDLSHNNLQGNIPSQLTELDFLEVFNVSCNDLSGKTPEKVKQFATFDESSYRDNPLLCGWPLQKDCATMESSPSISRSSNDTEESNCFGVDFYVSFGVAYAMVLLTIAGVLFINPYWRMESRRKEKSYNLHIKSHFISSSSSFMSAWGVTADCCSWVNIDCNATSGHVVKLSLYALGNMEFLDLSDNSFHKNILSSLSGLSSLKILSLYGNRLKGIINIEVTELDFLPSLFIAVIIIISYKNTISILFNRAQSSNKFGGLGFMK